MDPPPPPPTHSFFKPKPQPQPSASAASSSSSSLPPHPASLPSNSTTTTAKKRRPKAAAADPKQGKLSFASGSGLGVVAAAHVRYEEASSASPSSRGKSKAKARPVDDEEAEKNAMTSKKAVKDKDKEDVSVKPNKVKEGPKKKEINQKGEASPLTSKPALAAGSISISSSSPDPLLPPPPPPSPSHDLPTSSMSIGTAESKRHFVPNSLPDNGNPSASTSSKLLPNPSSSQHPASPSLLPSSPANSKADLFDLTQDDSDEGLSSSRHPSPASSAPPKLSGLKPKPHTVSIVSSDEEHNEVQAVASTSKLPVIKMKRRSQVVDRGEMVAPIPVEGEGDASSSKCREKAHSFFDKRASTTKQGPVQLTFESESEEDIVIVGSSSQGKSRPRCSSVVAVEALVKGKKPQPLKEVHSFFAKRKAVVRDGGVVTAAASVASRKQEEPVEARWPTREETHVGYLYGGENSSAASSSSVAMGKGKGREIDVVSEQDASTFFLANFSPQDNTSTSTAHRLFALLSSNAPTFTSSLPSSSTPSARTLVPPHLLSHPAFSRLLSPDSTPHPPRPSSRYHLDETWADNYKPRTAAEVLGNEAEATYLREWFLALQVQGKAKDEAEASAAEVKKGKRRGKAVIPAKRKIVRSVVKDDAAAGKKRRRRRRRKGNKAEYGEEDWIVASDEDEADPIFSDFDEFEDEEDQSQELRKDDDEAAAAEHNDEASSSTPTTPSRQRSSTSTPTYPSLASLLTNCILLQGPSGSGKTSSVYACAAELGWEVFEVWPGIGKRSAQALASLVGDMSKNHILAKGGTGGGSSVGASKNGGFFGRKANAFEVMMGDRGGGSSKPSGGGSARDAISLDDDGTFPSMSDTVFAAPRGSTRDPSPVKGEVVGSQPSKVRQSLILLEEVDVLFQEEDKGFWQGLIALISESRRPVVMTCNDLSTLPLHNLPLQAILEYQPPPASLAVPYLQLLASAQGFSPSLDSLRQLYTRTAVFRSPGSGLEDIVGHPAPSQEKERSGLRRVIAALQLGCCRSNEKGREPRAAGGVGDILDALERQGTHWVAALGDWSTGGKKEKLDNKMDVDASSSPAHSSLTTLDAISTLLEALSFSNAHVDIRTSTLMELEEIDRYGPSGDDEQGYNLLRKWKEDPVDGPPVLAGTGWEREMAVEMGVRAREKYDGEVEEGEVGRARAWSEGEMRERRSSHLLSLLTFLSPIIEPPTPLLPHPALLLSYAPYIRHLVAQDDTFLLEDAQGTLRAEQDPGREKRGAAKVALLSLVARRGGGDDMGEGGGTESKRYGYQRWLALEEDELREVRGSRLGLDW